MSNGDNRTTISMTSWKPRPLALSCDLLSVFGQPDLKTGQQTALQAGQAKRFVE